jgi:hypothetical protein
MPPSKLYVRLGSHAEKDYLLKTAKLFSGVILGANLVESTPGASVSLAWRYMGNLGREFAIDPITYVFGLDLSYITSETNDKTSSVKGAKKTGLKKSFVSLAKQLGGIVEETVLNQGRSLRSTDFSSQNSITELCESVLRYQRDRMRVFCEVDPQLSEVADVCREPSFYLSPYFYVEGSKSGWSDVTRSLITTFGTLESSVPRYGVLVIARALLQDRDWLLGMARHIADSGCDGCWIWISTFREETVTEAEIANLLLVVQLFEDVGKPIMNLHGGYLSILLSKFGMVGLSHGIGYGESKDVLPVSGGAVPTVTYHYPPLHVRAPIVEIDRSLSALNIFTAEDFHAKVCDCAICVGILKGNLKNIREFGDFVIKVGNKRESQTPDSAKKCRFHFLLARKKEIDVIANSSLADLKSSLSATQAEYSALPSYIPLRGRSIHLKQWLSKI